MLRIFRNFSEGQEVKALTKELNVEQVPGRRKVRRGWSPSTISRILKNEKYIGRWIWSRAAARWKEIDHSWPQHRARKIIGPSQRSYVETNPPQLLSGTLCCAACTGTIGQVSGKGSGYYGYLAAARGACSNKLLVSLKITGKAVLTAVREKLRDPASIRYVLERVEAEVKLLYGHLPEEIQIKRAALDAEERRIANYIGFGFIGEGKGTRAWVKP